MQRYILYEFSGYQLIEKLEKSENRIIDFSTRTKKSLAGVIKTAESHNDNALFYQMKRCIEEMQPSDNIALLKDKLGKWEAECLKDVLIYIDFSDVFPIERYACRKFHWNEKTSEEEKEESIEVCEEVVERLFSDGFEILYTGNQPPIKYVPFEKSASMARTGSMIFVDQRLYLPMEERVRLGFDFCATGISASKLYAYSGLYLSDAKRINESTEFVLNEETVIILADNVDHEFIVPEEVITGVDENPDVREGLQKWEIQKFNRETFKTTVTFFDGEGIISSKYAALINNVLNNQYGMTGTAASFQIRMPFTKGMLHHVDFHAFVCEMFGISSCSGVFIKDAYGKRRSLEKAQIILTQSMFKIDKWLRNKAISGASENEDYAALYFERFHRYEHAFYVGITDMNLSQAGKTKLNYQFLNTLALSEDELEEIVKEQVNLVTSASGKELLLKVSGGQIDEEGDTSFEDRISEGETWSTVAKQNPAFLKDPKVKGMLKGMRYSLLKDIGRGKLMVSGSTKFLSRDLLSFLSWIINKTEPDSFLSAVNKDKILGNIKKNRLRGTKFFVADCVPGTEVFKNTRRLKFESNQYYGLLRSPHLSRSEQCSLRPYIAKKGDIYSRYFGHLKGLLMVPYASLVPQVLGGADFDGDLVKIITDKRVNRAINESCYRPDATDSENKHIRNLPIVMIPDTKPKVIHLQPDMVHFPTLRDTFSSRVGEISNYAIYLGKREYDAKNPNPEYDLKCETCTILVGLEIDAAKTGRHPDLGIVLEEGAGKDYFVERKEETDKLPEQQYVIEVKEYEESQNTKGNIFPHRLAAVAKYGPNVGDELMTAVFTQDYKGKYYRIDTLPHRFLEELRRIEDNAPNSKENDKENGVRFLFEAQDGWKEKVSDNRKKEVVRGLIYAYKRIQKTAGQVYRIEERLKKSNYAGCINTIMKIQNKGLINEQQLTDIQEQVFCQLLEYFDSYQAAKKALDKLVNGKRWQFRESEKEKIQYLKKELATYSEAELSQNVSGILCNFRWNGYFLLYYYIKDIILYHHESETDLRIKLGEEGGEVSAHAGEYCEKYYDIFRKIYEQALSEKESKKLWRRRIVEECRNILREEFSGQVNAALMYVHALRNCDQYGTFFWDVFTSNEILQKSGDNTERKLWLGEFMDAVAKEPQ